MATTVKAMVFKHHRKVDGSHNVKIILLHEGKRNYLDTSHFVVKKQLTKDYKIKDPFIAEQVEKQLRDYR
ncbi:recombinase, partial [Sphingobacterium hotanense]|nr:recombinase [Sphingobacterium hotanense]